MKRIFLVLIVMMVVLSTITPAAVATAPAGGSGGGISLNLEKPDTGVYDESILQEIETPYPPSLKLLIIILIAAVVLVAAVFVARKLIKKWRSKRRDIYGRW